MNPDAVRHVEGGIARSPFPGQLLLVLHPLPVFFDDVEDDGFGGNDFVPEGLHLHPRHLVALEEPIVGHLQAGYWGIGHDEFPFEILVHAEAGQLAQIGNLENMQTYF